MDLKNPRQNPANFSHNNDCADVSTKNVNKKKWLRIFGAGGLAFFMGAGVLFGTLLAPMGAISASNSGDPAALAQSAESAQGLISPHEDDLIIGISDNGLNIKWANSLTSESAGFPYFVTNDGVKDYCWVVIGQNLYSSSINSQYSYAIKEFGYLDFCNSLDQSPAGVAIHLGYLTKIQHNDTEIPENSVLCVLNTIVTTGSYNSSSIYNYEGDGLPRYYPNYSTTVDIAKTMENYYQNESLGLGTIKTKIQSLSSINTYCVIRGSWTTTSAKDQHIFPLAANSSSSFYYGTYLSDENMKIDSDQWLRGTKSSTRTTYVSGRYEGHGAYMDTTGSLNDQRVGASYGYRPAFCLQIF